MTAAPVIDPRDRKLAVTYRSIGDLIPYARNGLAHSDAQLKHAHAGGILASAGKSGDGIERLAQIRPRRPRPFLGRGRLRL